MEFETIRYHVDGEGMARIALARPEKRNAIDLRMFQELGRATEVASDDERVRAVLVTGDGPSFCSGIDLGLLAELPALLGDTRSSRFGDFVRTAQRPILMLGTMPKPALAAVQGHALGAGFQLALACDLIVAAHGARFGLLEVRYGLIPDLGGPYRLARTTGPALAKELIWTARTMEAEEAHRLGVVNRVASPDGLQEAAEGLLREVLAHGPVAVRETKFLVEGAFDRPLHDELEREARSQATALGGGPAGPGAQTGPWGNGGREAAGRQGPAER